MLKRFLFGLFGLFGLVLLAVLGGYLLPRAVHVERSVEIARPPVQIYALLDGFARFNDWSPWYARDPEAEYARSGPERGVGATLSWRGGPEVGSGTQTVTVSEPHRLIEIELDFGRQGVSTTRYRLDPLPEGTRVTWVFLTDLGFNPVDRYLGLLLPRWIGADYEQGLANLKRLAESLPAGDWSTATIEPIESAAMTLLVLPLPPNGALDPAADALDPAALAEARERLHTFAGTAGLRTTDQMLLLLWPQAEGSYSPAVGIAVSSATPTDIPAPFQVLAVSAGPALRWVEPAALTTAAHPAPPLDAHGPAALPAYLATHRLALSGPLMLTLPDDHAAASTGTREWRIPVTPPAEPR